MRSSVMVAVACGVIAVVALAGESAKAANAWGGAFCLSYRDGGADCGFTTLAQCQASASGTDAGCYAAPPSLQQQQGASAPQAAPTPRTSPAIGTAPTSFDIRPMAIRHQALFLSAEFRCPRPVTAAAAPACALHCR